MSDKKKGVKKLISKTATKKQLKDTGYNVSEAGAKELSSFVSGQLRTYGEIVARDLVKRKKKTVTVGILQDCAGDMCPALCRSWVQSALNSSLTQAPVVRAFKRGLGQDYRISEDAKEALHGLATHMIDHVGDIAANSAHSNDRVSIKIRDIELGMGKQAGKKKRGSEKVVRVPKELKAVRKKRDNERRASMPEM